MATYIVCRPSRRIARYPRLKRVEEKRRADTRVPMRKVKESRRHREIFVGVELGIVARVVVRAIVAGVVPSPLLRRIHFRPIRLTVVRLPDAGLTVDGITVTVHLGIRIDNLQPMHGDDVAITCGWYAQRV